MAESGEWKEVVPTQTVLAGQVRQKLVACFVFQWVAAGFVDDSAFQEKTVQPLRVLGYLGWWEIDQVRSAGDDSLPRVQVEVV